MPDTNTVKWMRIILLSAAVYNFVWGSAAILFPLTGFQLAGIPIPNYPELWQCIGMMVGVYGVGYVIAATNPMRHWPIVLVGLLAKILGPLGFAYAVVHGRVPLQVGWAMLTNDVIWWIPFGMILYAAHEKHLGAHRQVAPEIVKFALRTRTSAGTTLDEISRQSPVLLVFLRHRGCPFCREALADIAAQRKEIEKTGTQIVLVHMLTEEHASHFFPRYGLAGVMRVSDPNKGLYRAFGLNRGSLAMILGPKAWFRGFQTVILKGHGIGRFVGDIFQMPGVFLLYHGEVIRSYRHQSAADRPSYRKIIGEDLLPS